MKTFDGSISVFLFFKTGGSLSKIVTLESSLLLQMVNFHRQAFFITDCPVSRVKAVQHNHNFSLGEHASHTHLISTSTN